MSDRVFKLNDIDFNQPTAEFTYKRQTYLLKYYFKQNFIRKKSYRGTKCICLLNNVGLANTLSKRKLPAQIIEQEFQKAPYYIQRCVQYKEVSFHFGISTGKYGFEVELEYFNCESHGISNLDELLEKPYIFFVKHAKTVYERELPLIKDKKLFHNFMKQKTKHIEFTCGSQSELERLTKIAAFTSSELFPLFEDWHYISITYESANDYYKGGIRSVGAKLLLYRKDENKENVLSQQSQQLFDLIFKYNSFTGIDWDYLEEQYGYLNYFPDGYGGYYPSPHTINIKVHSPLQHEKIEAALELQTWLGGKLPEAEIQALFRE